MVAVIDLHAARTAAAVIVRRFSAVNRLREAVRERPLADALRSDKNIRVVKPALLERSAQHGRLRGVAENIGSKRHSDYPTTSGQSADSTIARISAWRSSTERCASLRASSRNPRRTRS